MNPALHLLDVLAKKLLRTPQNLVLQHAVVVCLQLAVAQQRVAHLPRRTRENGGWPIGEYV
eukprot:4880816-Pyramimonas_sp.AAC.1